MAFMDAGRNGGKDSNRDRDNASPYESQSQFKPRGRNGGGDAGFVRDDDSRVRGRYDDGREARRDHNGRLPSSRDYDDRLPTRRDADGRGQSMTDRSRDFSRDDGGRSRSADIDADAHSAQPPDLSGPIWTPSGLLAADSNTFNGVALKYHEPPTAALCLKTQDWRLYTYAAVGGRETGCFALGRQSAFLLGREAKVADITVDEDGVSKQHAVIQFKRVAAGSDIIKPYIIDLESTNGTSLNGQEIEGGRYVELLTGDVIELGGSGVELVLVMGPSQGR